MENKQYIVKMLSMLLKGTRAGSGIDKLQLSEDEETVQIQFKTGCVHDVNVACDSGIAIIKDVINALM